MNHRTWVIILLWLFPLSICAQTDTIVFSAQGGFYEEVFQLELLNYYPQYHIRYTTNGNRPTAESSLYEGPLTLDEHLYSKSDIYTIVNCPEQDFFLPDSIRHCIVIRAAVFDENDSCISTVKTNSYFIRALGCDTHGLPAVSLSADSLDLFDYETGIFVPGVYFDPLDPNWTGNYYQQGLAWERPLNVEFYEQDNTGINQQAGLRTHGGNGRRFQQKCVKIYAREEYGKKRFKHKFFETILQNSFKHLVLKPFSASWNQTGVSDYLSNIYASTLDLETLASRPVVVYLNGEYWGIYYIHERPDEHYLEDHYDVDINHVNLISGWNPVLDHGTLEYFNSFYQWMENADLSDPDSYAYAETRMDMGNFIDYQIFEIITENTDWPANNTRMWQVDDGPWRWIFYDGDACMRWLTYNAFENAIYVGDAWWPSSTKSTLFFRKLLENEEFKIRFMSRFLDLLNNSFNYSVLGPFFDEIKERLEPEVPLQSERFGFPANLESWNKDMGHTQWFIMRRADDIIGPLSTFMNLPDLIQTPFHSYPNPSSGDIHITIDADAFCANEISIYDITGRKVYAAPCLLTEVNNAITIHPQLKAGIYVLRLGCYTQRIVRY